MDEGLVRRLAAAGETFTVEFKSDVQPLADHAIVEAVVCLANGQGGVLLIGVENDGRITGARHRHERGTVTDPFRLQALIANRSVPPAQTTVSVVPMDKRIVIAVEVSRAQRITGTNRGLYVRRARQADGSPACVAFPAHEMLAHEIDRGAVDYAALPVSGASWDDLDPLEFDRLRRLVKQVGPGKDTVLAELSDVDIARALGVVRMESNTPTPLAGALLLFGRREPLRRFIPTHEAAFQVLRGSRVEMNDFLPSPLFMLAEEFFARLRAYNTETELDAGLVRIAIPRLPEPVIREVVANALVHRDFTMMGAIHVQLTDEVLEVTSPGGFPPGVGLDNLLTAQRPRSPLLADALKRAGVVERTGRGINRMFEVLLRSGRDAPDYTRSTSESVTASITLADPDLPLLRYVLDRERQDGAQMRLADLQVLHEVRREGHLTTQGAAGLLQQTETSARATLTRMVEHGLVEARGTGRGRTYHLSSAVYRSLDAASAHTRIRGFDRLQQEQMTLGYVRAHGRVTRREVAELCSLTPDQASALLRDLADAGQLSKRGERRWTFYIIPPAGIDPPNRLTE